MKPETSVEEVKIFLWCLMTLVIVIWSIAAVGHFMPDHWARTPLIITLLIPGVISGAAVAGFFIR